MSLHSQQISATEELWEADGQFWARSNVRAREPARAVDDDRWPAGVSPSLMRPDVVTNTNTRLSPHYV